MTFMQDGTSCHTAATSLQWIQDGSRCHTAATRLQWLQDGARCYTAATSLQWLQDQQVNLWGREERPSNFTNLNPIKNLWSILK